MSNLKNLNLLRHNEARARLRRSRSQILRDIEAGVLPPPIKLGPRMVAFLEAEIDAVVRARIAGKSAEEIRGIVAELVAARQKAAA